MWLLCEGFQVQVCIYVCGSDHQTQTTSPVLNKKSPTGVFILCYGDAQLKETAVSDSLERMTRKETNIQDHFINKADIFPSRKWHVSHFSLRWVCE